MGRRVDEWERGSRGELVPRGQLNKCLFNCLVEDYDG